MILENEMLRALRKTDARATLAHLAYARTMEPPVQVKPAAGIFLESAPIGRTWSEPISRREAKKKLPWRKDVFLQDLAACADRGIRHVTSFAVYVDADYVRQYGEPPLEEYGKGLRDFSKP